MSICPRLDSAVLPCRHYIKSDRPNEAGYCKLPIYYRCVEAMAKYSISLSHSAANQYSRCKRAYWFNYIKGIGVYDTMLPDGMKIGAIWDTYQNSEYGGTPFDIDKALARYFGTSIDTYVVSKIRALIRAWKELGMATDLDCKPQSKSFYTIDNTVVSYVLDREYKDHFVEGKCTSTENLTDFYFSIHYLSQLGTYFLSSDRFKYAIMEVVRVPQLKLTGQYKEEGLIDHEERCFTDIVSRPSYYFPGYDKVTKKFGKKFMRHEFNLKEIENKYRAIASEIKWRMSGGREVDWYKEEGSCLFPGKCLYYEICYTGGFPDNIYHLKEKEDISSQIERSNA